MSDISVVVANQGKTGGLETCNVYLLNVPVFFAKVHAPQKKFNSEEKEYGVTVFIDEVTKDKLLDEVLVNKTFAKVGVDKTTKPPRRIKFPLSSQADEGKTNYDAVDGMFGFTVAKAEFSKAGKRMFVNVVDAAGEKFTADIGNGSICSLKLFGYRNQDGQLVVSLDTVKVVEHVPYEGGTSDGTVTDDVLGVKYTPNRSSQSEAPAGQEAPKADEKPQATRAAKPAAKKAEQQDQYDQDIPF